MLFRSAPPIQSLIEEHFDACQPDGPTTRLVSVAPEGRVYFNFVNETDVPKMVKVWVTPEGRFYIEGHWTDPERVEQCMQARFGYQFRTP